MSGLVYDPANPGQPYESKEEHKLKIYDFAVWGSVAELLEACAELCQEIAGNPPEGASPGFISGAIACQHRIQAELVRRRLLGRDDLPEPEMPTTTAMVARMSTSVMFGPSTLGFPKTKKSPITIK